MRLTLWCLSVPRAVRSFSRRSASLMAAAAPVGDIESLYATYKLADAPAATASLLAWWDAGHRSMPWRRESGEAVSDAERERWAYRVWVSEVMLQQTQVSRVTPYFERWVARWPDVGALAAAEEAEVRALWSGLGYYRRCKFLLEGAADLARPGAVFPTTRAEWLKVRGVGPYTAAAVASIVYGEAVPVVDGNVIRVASRLAACGERPTSTTSMKLWWRLAAQVVPPDCARPGDANQALMELGATVCTKAAPACGACPLALSCRARASGGDVARFPAVEAKPKAARVSVAVLVLQLEALGPDYVALARPTKDRAASAFRLADVFELPGARLRTTSDDDDDDDAAVTGALDGALQNARSRPAAPGETVASRDRAAKAVAHSITSTRYAVRVERRVLRGAEPDAFDVEWVRVDALATKATSSIVAKALAALAPKTTSAKKRDAAASATKKRKVAYDEPPAAAARPLGANSTTASHFASFAFTPDDEEAAA